MSRRKPALALLTLALLLPNVAGAQPSLWDRARRPAEHKAYQALVSVERMLSRAEESDFDFGLQRNFTRAALAMLELAGGGALPDPRLQFLLADLLLDADMGREREARALLDRALDQASDSQLKAQGWFWLAIASAKLRDSAREHEAYTRALELTWERDARATIFMNRGESKMALSTAPGSKFRLRDAIADFRHALALADRPDLQALALYDLGTALERSGDLPAALDAMARARTIQLGPIYPSALDLPSVFFVPHYDLFYYKALEAMAAARAAKDVRERADHWERAIQLWSRYLADAERERAYWVDHARLHRSTLEKRLQELAPEIAKQKPRTRASEHDE